MTLLLGSLTFLGMLMSSLASSLQPMVDKRQTDVCVAPANDPNYLPQCQEALENLANEVMSLDLNQLPQELNETSMLFSIILSVYCTDPCIQPQLDYFDCTGDAAAISATVDGTCSRMDDRFCISKVLDGIVSSQVSLAVYDSLFLGACTTECTSDCLDIVQSAINYLGCCADGVFSPEASGVLVSCQISLSSPCPSDLIATGTTPTAQPESCVLPQFDPSYPIECVDALNSINYELAKLLGADFKLQDVDEALENITDLLAVHCSSECIQPTLNYLQCLVGETETEESIASFQCGQNNGTFCLVQTLKGVSDEVISADVLDTTFAQVCNTNCTNQCRENIDSLVGYLGCCSRGLLPNLDVFESCGLAAPDDCPIMSITPATPTGGVTSTDRTTPTVETAPTNDDTSNTRTTPTTDDILVSNPALNSTPSSATASTFSVLAFLLATLCAVATKRVL